MSKLELALEKRFDPFLYFDILDKKVFKWNHKDFFRRYVKSVNERKGKGFTHMANGKPKFDSVDMINLINRIYLHDISPYQEELSALENLSKFEQWAVNPEEFDYSCFDSDWLLVVGADFVLRKLSHIPEIRRCVESRLSDQFNSDLAEIYFKYFSHNSTVTES